MTEMLGALVPWTVGPGVRTTRWLKLWEVASSGAERAGTSSRMGYIEATRWAEALNWPTDEGYCNVIQSWEVILKIERPKTKMFARCWFPRHLVIQSSTK
jgi:hypothetical protein